MGDLRDGFLFGCFEEAAGVNHDRVGVIIAGHGHEAILSEQAEHLFGVDEILGATQ